MSSDPIEVLREVYWAGWLNASTWANRDDQLDDRGSEAYKKLEGEAVQPALASLSAPKPPPMNDNAVVVNESAPVNDKPKSAEAAAWAVTCPSGRTTAYMHPDPPKLTEPGWSARPLVYGDTAPPRPEASDEAWLLDPRTVEAKSQWDAVARALGADVDDPDAVLAAAKAKQASAPVGVEGVVKAMRMLAGVGIPVKPECVGRWADQLEALAQQPATVEDLNAWRAAFVAERATRYREGGMAIEQVRIHAETDAERMALAAGQQPAAVDGAMVGWSLRHEGGMIRVIGPDGRSYAAVDPSLAGQQLGGES